MVKVRSSVTENNFKGLLTPAMALAKVTETPTIALNSWAWNDIYKAAHVSTDSATAKATADINLGFIKAGESIQLSAQFMNVRGVKAKIILDMADNQAFTVGAVNALIFQSYKTNEFEDTTITFVAKKDGYYKALFGLLTADIGEYYMRNCVAKVDTIVDLYSTNYKQVTKFGAVKTSSVGVFERDKRFGADEFTVTVNANYILLNFTAPFTNSVIRPQCVIGLDATSKQYVITPSAPQSNGVTIQFWDATTKALLDHTAIATGIFFSFIMVGYDTV